MGMPDLHRASMDQVAGNVIDVEHKLEAIRLLLARLVEIAERRIAIDEANAQILSGVMAASREAESPAGFSDYREGLTTEFEVLGLDGAWRPATHPERMEIAAMIQDRKRRR